MANDSQLSRDDDALLRRIVEGTAGKTGEKFFDSLTKNLAAALGTYAAWVTEWLPDARQLRICSIWINGAWQKPFDYEVTGTACETAVEQLGYVHVPDNILQVYPGDNDPRFGAPVSYLGVALRDTQGAVLGHLAVLDDKPMPANPRALALFQIFAGRAAAELQYLRAERELQAREGYGDIIGKSDAMRRALQDVQQVAETDSTVLILGETGVGKELFARAIHAASKRSDKPLIKVNCAAIPATLIESEFFGHEKGAFTGATAQREGRFALADGGTIFLDEIGDLPFDLQAKLLRVLQEGEFEPVGSSRTRKVNVRVIAATNRNLLQDVRDGKFREDLYYRLNVFPIEVPPLRERGDDVLSLAAAFARKFAKQMGRGIEPLTENCARRLKAYDWPGNVRELQNVIERAVITARDGRLNLDRALPESATVAPPATTTAVLTTTELRQLERQNIERALEACAWKVAGKDGAAQLLDMSPSTLNSRIKALAIKRV